MVCVGEGPFQFNHVLLALPRYKTTHARAHTVHTHRVLSPARVAIVLLAALRYGHVHLTEVAVEAASAQGTAAGEMALAPLRVWFEALLGPRPGCAAEPEPEERAEARARRPVGLSPWLARGLVVRWLERQAEHGRSRLLVPELLALEDGLFAQHENESWLHGLWQLVQHLRWGIGEFWAPHYDTSPDTARSMFAANILATSSLHGSAGLADLSAHRMCLPRRVGISPTIHQLIGHGGAVTSAQFSPDGQKIVSASSDNTVRVWSAVSGACEQELEGHNGPVTSAQFGPDGQKIVSASEDMTAAVRVWSATKIAV